jgi:hypothetical protein
VVFGLLSARTNTTPIADAGGYRGRKRVASDVCERLLDLFFSLSLRREERGVKRGPQKRKAYSLIIPLALSRANVTSGS